MPTLEAASRLDNIYKSVNVFVDTHIRIGLSTAVYYMGQNRVGTLPGLWTEVEPMPPESISQVRTHGLGKLAIQKEFHLNINVFQQLDTGLGNVNPYPMATLVTNIMQRFEIDTGIPVYDYNTVGNPRVGGLMVWESPEITTLDTDPTSGIKQVNVSVCLRYVSVTTL